VTDGDSDGKEDSQDRKKGASENRLERQTLPLRQVPQTKPETCKNSGPLVLSELPPRKGRLGLMKILFLHGWHSIPGGLKPAYLADHGHTVLNPQLPDDDFDESVRIAQAEYDKHQPQVVVGSSRGGAVALNINSGEARLVLLCPAWKKYGSANSVKANTTILHSRADDVIQFADSEELVRKSGLPAYTLVETGNDHRLADPESLEMMLESCLIGKEEEDEPSLIEQDEDILEKDWAGLCYTAALTWAKEAEEEWIVVHGSVWSDQLGKRIKHAWCERGRFVVDLAMPVGARIIHRDQYYEGAKPEVARTYSAHNALLLSLKNRHHGPWNDDEQLEE